MRPSRRASRTLIGSAALAGCLAVTATFGAPFAGAHVHVTADGAKPGGYAILTFSVPNESEKGAATTQLSVALPDVASASTETLPGWTAKLDRDAAAGTVRSVTWTAAPQAGIPPDQFGLFRLSVKLPDTPTVTLPATQTYSDGTVVRWDQPTTPGGAEPEHPAPTLDLASGGSGHGADADAPTVTAQSAGPAQASSDDTARWLAGAALVLAALGLVTALVRSRRA